jgi:hypothetical protein
MKHRILIAIGALVCGGCVTAPLERYAVNQSLSTSEMRYQEVMNALAVVAANQGRTLPSYSVTSSGFSNVTATVSMQATTTWARAAHNFSQQLLNVLGKHSPELSWTLDPVAEQVLLEGAWYACRWAIYGPPTDPAEYQKESDLLRKPVISDIVGYGGGERQFHLDVLDDPIPMGWLGVGPRGCVPRGACYSAHCGDTYAWVTADQMPQLSQFTLVLLDIATTGPTWIAQQKQQALATVELGMPGSADQTKSTITETWAAYQVTMKDGSTNIVIAPFAEPSAGSHVIEKSTLSLYLPPAGAQLPPQTNVKADAKTDTPQYAPVPGAPSGMHQYK